MINNKKRPINLNLTTIKFPIMAIVSILHRISGVILFLLMPMIMYFCVLSLKSSESFLNLQNSLNDSYCKFILWGFLSAIIYHLLAGIRHLLMDCGYGDNLKTGRCSAILLIILSIIFIFILGLWLW